MPKPIENNLTANKEANYGAEYKSHCLEIYKLYVEKADAISNRRQSTNFFFLTINTTIMGVVGYDGIRLALGLAGVLLCYYWYRLILSYKQLSSGKFKVIHEIEKELPLSPYDDEWEAIGGGKDPKLYTPLTYLEMAVPWIFLATHLGVILFSYWLSASDFLSKIVLCN